MHYLINPPKNKVYVTGRGFVYQNYLNGDLLSNSIKSKVKLRKMTGSGLSEVSNKIEGAMDKGVAVAKSNVENMNAKNIIKSVAQNPRNIINKGQAIPNAEAFLEQAAKSIPLKSVVPRVKGPNSIDRPLSELLSKKRGQGIRIHGEGIRLHGEGIRVNGSGMSGGGIAYI